MGSATPPLPYWQVNVAEELRTALCPDFLQNLNAKDVGILSTPDADYHMLTWAEVRQTVAANRLDAFQRVPSELRRYLAYIWQLRLDHGSVLNFVRTRRIAWPEPAAPEGRPFECDADVKVLWNDWPYGIDKRIVHLVVWTKFDLAEDPATGDLSDQARKEIDDYVQKTFCSVLPKESVVWFKNWASLKSVKAVEHFHVMLFDPDPDFVKQITNGDVPLSLKFGKE